MASPVVNDVRLAASDPPSVILEGFHAVKHALRFGAELKIVAAVDLQATLDLARELAPDIADALAQILVPVAAAELQALAPRIHTGVIAVAMRPGSGAEALRARHDAPVVLLEDPRNLGNVGAVIRVAAAAGAAGVLTTGPVDPWDRSALRGSAGLHFALPVDRVPRPPEDRPLIGLAADGDSFAPGDLPAAATLAFGTERDGLSPGLRGRCDALVSLPMRAGVSSLNLATAVAATLYAWRIATEWRPDEARGPLADISATAPPRA